MPQITRRLEFDAAHRIVGHEGKCRALHGHRYVAEVTVYAPALDRLGRVVDFGKLKEVLGGWIDRHLDHNIILAVSDPLAGLAVSPGACTDPAGLWAGKAPYLLVDVPPTAENLAEHLFNIAQGLLPEFQVVSVRLYETPSCWADYPSAFDRRWLPEALPPAYGKEVPSGG